ncbi:MAG: PQQ-binding-like beta-propeller repeat protein [Planctomycetes bacterium]|nr:PQQ-binding-like beta-propeller repeat protein [Planctomycetota bacterium]
MPRVGGPNVGWSALLSSPPACALTVSAGMVLAGTAGGTIHAFHAGSGVELWRTDLGAPVTGQPVVAGANVFAGTSTGNVIALDAATGQRGQVARCGAAVAAPLATDGQRVVAATSSGLVKVFDAAGLLPRTQIQLGAPPAIAPAIAGGLVIVASAAGRVQAYDLERGLERWSYQMVGGTVGPMLVTAAAPQRVHLGSAAGTVVALDLANGRERWRYSGNGVIRGLAGAEGRLIAASAGLTLVELDRETGSRIGTSMLGGVPDGAPAFCAAGAAVALEGGRVELLNAELQRVAMVDLAGTYSGPPVAQGERVYIGLRQRLVYCLRF